MKNLIFVDREATGPCPGKGELTEFGAVAYESRRTFHGVLLESRPRKGNPALAELSGKAFDPVAVFSAFEQWLLAETSLNRVEAQTDVENIAEQRSLEKAGFVREGIARGAQFRAGSFHDLVTYSRLRADP